MSRNGLKMLSTLYKMWKVADEIAMFGWPKRMTKDFETGCHALLDMLDQYV